MSLVISQSVTDVSSNIMEKTDINTPDKSYLLGCYISENTEVKIKDEIHDMFLKNEDSKWAFLKGYYESCGFIYTESKDGSKICGMKFITPFTEYIKIPYIIEDDNIIFKDTNAIDFLGKIYERLSEMNEQLKYNVWKEWLGCSTHNIPECFVYKTNPNAIIPTKSKMSDAGYDLSVISVKNKISDMVSLYDTGIQVEVKHGLYIEVVPRSSLSKSGYMLANSIGIIDANYRGNILVALIKINPNAPDIEFPFRCCQLIFRKQVYVTMKESETLSETARGEGGFGSTGK